MLKNSNQIVSKIGTVKAEQAGFSSCMESEESLIPESFLDNHSKRSFRPSALTLLSTRANIR